MALHTAPDVTATSAPEHHVGLNYVVSKYTLGVTASASLSITLAKLPAGARVVSAELTIDNANLSDTATATALQSVQLWNAGTVQLVTAKPVNYISSAQAGTQVNVFSPSDVGLGYRVTSSSNVVYHIDNFPVGSGTTTTIFTLALAYDCQLDGD